MAAIAGVFSAQARSLVERMLKRMEHRERGGIRIQALPNATLGVIRPESLPPAVDNGMVEDGNGHQHYVLAGHVKGRPLLERDALGVVPLYYGRREDGALCFASEVKGLLEATNDIREFPPGCRFDGETVERYFELTEHAPLTESPDRIAAELRSRLEKAVQKMISSDEIGCYLSGGLDSSVMAALARPHVKRLWTVAAGRCRSA